MFDIARLILKNKGMFTGMKGNLSAGVTLARGLKIMARFYKKISQIGLPHHLGQLYHKLRENYRNCKIGLKTVHQKHFRFL